MKKDDQKIKTVQADATPPGSPGSSSSSSGDGNKPANGLFGDMSSDDSDNGWITSIQY